MRNLLVALTGIICLVCAAGPVLGTVTTLRDGLNGYGGTTDSWVNDGSDSRNYGQGQTLRCEWNNGIQENIVLKFNLAGQLAPHQVISDARLKIYYYDEASFSDNNVVRLTPYRLTASWEEGYGDDDGVAGQGVSWDYRDVAEQYPWTGENGGWNDKADDGCGHAYIKGWEGTDPNAIAPAWPGAEVSFAVTPTVQKWYLGQEANNGFLIAATDFSGSGYMATGYFRSRQYADYANYRPTLEITHTTAPITWTGAADGNWNTSAVNWTWTYGATTFAGGDLVQFNESTRQNINIVGTVQPASVTFGNSAATNYVFSGGAIGGATGITKNGAGKVTLTAANSYTGDTTVNEGVLNVRHASALGTAAGGTSVASGAALEMEGNVTVAGEALRLRGSGIGGAGALRSLSGSSAWNGAVTLEAHTTVGVDAGSMTIGGSIGGGNYNLAKTGAGALVLGAANTYSGTTSVLGGTLRYGIDNAIAGGPIQVESGATLDIGAYSDAVGAVVLVDGSITGAGGVLAGSGYDLRKGAVSAILGGSGGVTKSTAETVVLSGANVYSGPTAVPAGTLRLGAGGVIPDASSVDVGGTLDLDGHDETIGPLAGDGAVALGAGTLTVNTNLIAGKFFSGVIDGPGGLAKTGLGTQGLTGPNTYEGMTKIAQGTLTLGPGGSIAGSAVIVIDGGATLDVSAVEPYALAETQTLKGSGRVRGDLDILGTIAPGTSAGRLTTEGLTFEDGSVLEIEIGGRGQGTEYDVLAADGMIGLKDGSTLAVTLSGGFEPILGDEFDLMDFTGLKGKLALDLPDLGGGLDWDTKELYTQGLLRVTPEPATLALVLAGACGTWLSRRRRRAARSAG